MCCIRASLLFVTKVAHGSTQTMSCDCWMWCDFTFHLIFRKQGGPKGRILPWDRFSRVRKIAPFLIKTDDRALLLDQNTLLLFLLSKATRRQRAEYSRWIMACLLLLGLFSYALFKKATSTASFSRTVSTYLGNTVSVNTILFTWLNEPFLLSE